MALDESMIKMLDYDEEQHSASEIISQVGKKANCYALAKYVMRHATDPALIVTTSTENGSHFAVLELNDRKYIDITGAGPRILPITMDTDLEGSFQAGHFGFKGITKYLYQTNKSPEDIVHLTEGSADQLSYSLVSYPADPVGFMHRLADTFTPDELRIDACACVMETVIDISYAEAHCT